MIDTNEQNLSITAQLRTFWTALGQCQLSRFGRQQTLCVFFEMVARLQYLRLKRGGDGVVMRHLKLIRLVGWLLAELDALHGKLSGPATSA